MTKQDGDRDNVNTLPLIYHVVITAYHKEALFSKANNCNNLAYLIFETTALHEYELFAFCIMPDHAHILCQPGNVMVAHFVNLLRFRFEYVLAKGGRKGPVWQPDYREQTLPMDQIVSTAAFILENPVRNGLVDNFIDYPYSFLLGGKKYEP
ncbi:MAG: transposase [Firmicutes bacterium]|nr:transposase [Bacillota bacterium]